MSTLRSQVQPHGSQDGDRISRHPGGTTVGDGAEIKAAWDAAQESGYDLKELLIGGSPFGS